MLYIVVVFVELVNMTIRNENDTYMNDTIVRNIDRFTKKTGIFHRKTDSRCHFSNER